MIIKINELKVSTIIGVYGFEKHSKRELVFNVEFETNCYDGKSDNLADTLDYTEIANLITAETQNNSFNLIEKLAHHLLEKLRNHPKISSARLEIIKPSCIENAASTSVVVGF